MELERPAEKSTGTGRIGNCGEEQTTHQARYEGSGPNTGKSATHASLHCQTGTQLNARHVLAAQQMYRKSELNVKLKVKLELKYATS